MDPKKRRSVLNFEHGTAAIENWTGDTDEGLLDRRKPGMDII